jgi:hypothetical protein
MSSFTNKEYLELCRALAEAQYDSTEEDEPVEVEYFPYEPPAKKRFKPNTQGVVDLTNTKSNQIKELLWKCTNLKVGNFKIKISHYTGEPGQNGPMVSMRLSVWEEKHKTPNGHPCRMDFPVIWSKDTRFTGRPWLKYFTGSSYQAIPIETVVDIIRWFQIVNKLPAFL